MLGARTVMFVAFPRVASTVAESIFHPPREEAVNIREGNRPINEFKVDKSLVLLRAATRLGVL